MKIFQIFFMSLEKYTSQDIILCLMIGKEWLNIAISLQRVAAAYWKSPTKNEQKIGNNTLLIELLVTFEIKPQI